MSNTRRSWGIRALLVGLAAVVITAGLAPLAYLRADIKDNRGRVSTLELEQAEQLGRLAGLWESVDLRLQRIETDVRFLRDQTIQGLHPTPPQED